MNKTEVKKDMICRVKREKLMGKVDGNEIKNEIKYCKKTKRS